MLWPWMIQEGITDTIESVAVTPKTCSWYLEISHIITHIYIYMILLIFIYITIYKYILDAYLLLIHPYLLRIFNAFPLVPCILRFTLGHWIHHSLVLMYPLIIYDNRRSADTSQELCKHTSECIKLLLTYISILICTGHICNQLCQYIYILCI